jgi:hypothetical protein
MQQVLSFLKSLFLLCIFCGVLFLLMEMVDRTFSPFILPNATAQAAQPSKNVEPVKSTTRFSPSQYENQGKDVGEPPP